MPMSRRDPDAHMLLTINSALSITVWTKGQSQIVTLEYVTRTGSGPVSINTFLIPATANTTATVVTVPLLADELLYYSLTAPYSQTDGGISAQVNLAYQSGGTFTLIATLSWGSVYTLPTHSWANVQLAVGDDIQARPFGFAVANPPAGSNVVVQHVAVAWSVESLRCRLVTDVNVAGRLVNM